MENSTQRLGTYLAHLGICSRRESKLYVKSHNVTVNGTRIKEAGERIDPQHDDIRIQGNKIKQPKFVYYLVNKPKGIISTTADEYGRKNVLSLVPRSGRIYPVGRLDKDTTGLLILTNDGELTNLLTHPKYHVDKTYLLTIAGKLEKAQLRALEHGVLLTDGITAPAVVKVVRQQHTVSHIEMIIHEGRNRQIRRMCETVGVNLLELQRIKFGPISIGQLELGKFRELSDKEIQALKKLASSSFL